MIASSQPARSAKFALHLFLALLFAFGSEIILWIDPFAHPFHEWILLAIGYWALAAIILDWLARYRVMTFFGLVAAAGVYGMLNALLLNPQMALIDIPRTLITRVMGAHPLMGLLALAVFSGMMLGIRGRVRRVILLILFALLGVGWGGWARWSGAGTIADSYGVTPAFDAILIVIGGVMIAAIAAAWWFWRSRTPLLTETIPPGKSPLKLSPLAYVIALGGLAVNGIYHAANGHFDSTAFTIIITLVIFVWAILWFSTRKKGIALVERIGGESDPPLYWLVCALVLLAGGVIGFNLARQPDAGDPAAWYGVIFTAAGLVWLPALMLVVGGRAMGRRARSLRL